MSTNQGNPDFDLDEDLLDFPGLTREPDPLVSDEDLEQVLESFQDPTLEEELLSVPKAAASKTAEHGAVAVAPAPEAPARTAGAERAERTHAHGAAPEPLVELPVSARSARFSTGLVAVAAAVTLLNSIVAVVAVSWRSSEHDVRAIGNTAAVEPASGAHADVPQATEAELPEPDGIDALHAHPTLDEAREQISRGEYGAARQRVYGLLAIIDRLEDPRRGALEADCQFLIAQSLHLEALARMGGNE